tara:strand:+ start:593 stop:1834 length:1242 start_codon:yes stop_codon:yes gene_type:complete
MADQVKEIFAGAVTTADIASTGSYTLATTDSTTQFVIKDVTIDGVFIGTPKLKINTTNVASLNASVSGSEIVDVSSTIKYSIADTAPTFSELLTVSYDNNAYKTYKSTTPVIMGVAGSTTTTITGNPNSLLSNTQIVMFAISDNDDLYYASSDGNSTNELYKTSATGTNNSIASLSYGWAVYDGGDHIYYVNNGYSSSVLWKYNIQTDTSTNAAQPRTIGGSSYPMAMMTNNNTIVSSATSLGSSVLLFIDPATNSVVSVSTGVAWPSKTAAQYNGYVHYEASTNRYTIYRRGANVIIKTVLDDELVFSAGASVIYNGTITQTTSSLSNPFITGNEIRYCPAGGDATSFTQIRRNQSNTADKNVYTGSDETVISNYLSHSIPSGTVTDMFVPKTASDFPASVNVRVTGIQTTL